ncbi:hypothetical protein ENUP19_0305G0045 [Entamoeba nuttalli]
MRTIPVDSALYQSIIEFIHSFKKKKVAMIYTNDPSGNSGYFRVNKLCNQKNIALLDIQDSENMPDIGNLDGINTVISNMYMEELFDTWKRFPKIPEKKYVTMVISEADFELNGFKEVLNNKTNVVIASLFSEINDICKELESKFGNTLPPLGKGYYDVVVSLVEGWKKCGNTYNFTKFISSKFTGTTGKVLFDSNGDIIGVMGISRLLLGNNRYPVISQFENNTIRFVSNSNITSLANTQNKQKRKVRFSFDQKIKQIDKKNISDMEESTYHSEESITSIKELQETIDYGNTKSVLELNKHYDNNRQIQNSLKHNILYPLKKELIINKHQEREENIQYQEELLRLERKAIKLAKEIVKGSCLERYLNSINCHCKHYEEEKVLEKLREMNLDSVIEKIQLINN